MKILFYAALCCVLVHQIKADEVTINVGVIDDSPSMNDSVKQATEFVETIIKTAKDKHITLDIIVLPEYGLTGLTYDTQKAIKIDMDNSSSSPELKGIHDLAKNNTVILVANLLEKDGDDLYSTTVVLDGTNSSSSTLLAKYQKINLKDEEKSLKSASEITTFKHDKFGTIGLMSGDDIAYENPARKLIDNKVQTILYTSSKNVSAPFDTPVSLYAGFAKAHGVNLVVSNLNDEKNHISGSGIFTPCGPKWEYIDTTPNHGVGTIKNPPSDQDCLSTIKKPLLSTLGRTANISVLPTYNLDGLITELIKNTNLNNSQICDDSFCCTFTVTSDSWAKEEHYRTVVSKEKKICGLIACSDTDDQKVKDTCGRIDGTTTKTFTNITISTTEDGDLFVPYILHNDLTPGNDLEAVKFVYVKDKGTRFSSDKVSIKDIIAIGIVAAKSGADSLHFIATNLIVLSLLLKYLLK